MHKFIIEHSYFYGTSLVFSLVASFTTETEMSINTFPSCDWEMENRTEQQRTVIFSKQKTPKFRGRRNAVCLLIPTVTRRGRPSFLLYKTVKKKKKVNLLSTAQRHLVRKARKDPFLMLFL